MLEARAEVNNCMKVKRLQPNNNKHRSVFRDLRQNVLSLLLLAEEVWFHTIIKVVFLLVMQLLIKKSWKYNIAIYALVAEKYKVF